VVELGVGLVPLEEVLYPRISSNPWRKDELGDDFRLRGADLAAEFFGLAEDFFGPGEDFFGAALLGAAFLTPTRSIICLRMR
jgi:hypothetical protein